MFTKIWGPIVAVVVLVVIINVFYIAYVDSDSKKVEQYAASILSTQINNLKDPRLSMTITNISFIHGTINSTTDGYADYPLKGRLTAQLIASDDFWDSSVSRTIKKGVVQTIDFSFECTVSKDNFGEMSVNKNSISISVD